jgi:hypothetical protein
LPPPYSPCLQAGESGIIIASAALRKRECMEIDYKNMKLDELETICLKAEKYLTKMLLNGASWSDVQRQMLLVTQISIAIHRIKYPVDGDTSLDNLSSSK